MIIKVISRIVYSQLRSRPLTEKGMSLLGVIG